jgi:two-component system, response regulator YesN
MSPVKILIVEDEDILRELLVESLEDYGHSCLEAENGLVALKHLEKSGVDFIITDIKMPEMDGLTMLQEIQKGAYSDVPTLIVSGFSDIKNDQEAVAIGAIGFRKKPYDLDEICLMVRQHFERSEEK